MDEQCHILIKVINKLSGSISPTIHWHGFLMRNGAYWYDGVMGITQCGIQQDHEFTYKLGSPQIPKIFLKLFQKI